MTRILIEGLATGDPSPADGQYVVEYDPARDGVHPETGDATICHLVTSPDPNAALELSVMDAFELWRSVDPRNPTRPDGKPNRPLTAFTVRFV